MKTVQIEFEGARRLENGNFFPIMGGPYCPRSGVMPAVGLYEGEEFPALINISGEAILIKPGYQAGVGTTDDLILRPGEAIIRLAGGDGWSTSVYLVK